MKEHRKLAAVMFTDIIGYTALMSKDEQKALALLQKNREMQKSLAEKHNGEFLKEMGDGTMLCFQSALDAVLCAMEIQQSVKDDPDLNLHIGIHLGDIVFKDGDVFGDGVNVASRIEGMAEAGGIFISGQVYEVIRNKPGIKAIFVGEKMLKNISHPVKIYTLLSNSISEKQNEIPAISPIKEKGKSIAVLPFTGDFFDLIGIMGFTYAKSGQREEALRELKKLEDLQKNQDARAFEFCLIHTGLGNNDEAFKWLDIACKNHQFQVLLLGPESELWFEDLLPDPKYKEFLTRIGFES